MTHATTPHLTPHRADSVGQLQHVSLVLAQQMKHQPKSRLAPYAWQFGKLLYCTFQQL
jgi:hypothetical protein